MTAKEDFMKLVTVLRAAYNSDKFMPDRQSAMVWYEMLKDIEYPILMQGCYKLIQSSPYPPTIADIRASCASLQAEAQLPDLEAWAMVRKALSNGVYGAEEEYAKLPPLVQKAVGTPANIREMAQADMESVATVFQSQFLRAYRAEVQRAADMAKLSPKIRTLLEGTAATMIEGGKTE
jgi:hypothetical protein